MEDRGFYIAFKYTTNKLYIHNTDKTILIDFDGLGKNSVKIVFADVDRNL